MDFEMLVVSYLTSIICFSLVLHFGFHDAWLATPYYISYFLPGCVLTIVVLAGEAERHGGRIFGNAAVYGGTGFILFAWFAHPLLPDPAILSSWSLWLTVAAVIVGAALTTQYAAAASLVLVAGAVLLSLCLYQNSFYDIRIWSSRADAEWDVYHGAILLEQFVDAERSNERSRQVLVCSKRQPEDYREAQRRAACRPCDDRSFRLDPICVSVGIHADFSLRYSRNAGSG